VAELTRFCGIIISIFFKDHGIPHIHAWYGGFEASVSMADGSVLAGHLPRRELGRVREWILLNQSALYATWDRASRGKSVSRLPPLR